MPASIEAKIESFSYRSKSQGPVLQDIRLSVSPNTRLTIVGTSGCGKTTLLRILAGLISPGTGSVQIGDCPAAIALKRRQIALVPQQPALFPWMTVAKNVGLPSRVGRRKTRPQNKAVEFLKIVSLTQHASKYPHELSGGMQQRVGIATAFNAQTPLLIMDEPFQALDEPTRQQLNDSLLTLWRHVPKTILLVTHSILEALYVGTRIIVLGGQPGSILLDIDVPDLPRNESFYSHPIIAEMHARILGLLTCGDGLK